MIVITVKTRIGSGELISSISANRPSSHPSCTAKQAMITAAMTAMLIHRALLHDHRQTADKYRTMIHIASIKIYARSPAVCGKTPNTPNPMIRIRIYPSIISSTLLVMMRYRTFFLRIPDEEITALALIDPHELIKTYAEHQQLRKKPDQDPESSHRRHLQIDIDAGHRPMIIHRLEQQILHAEQQEQQDCQSAILKVRSFIVQHFSRSFLLICSCFLLSAIHHFLRAAMPSARESAVSERKCAMSSSM